MENEIDLRKYRPVFTPEKLLELKDVITKSTQVVNWYDHGLEDGTIRGPWNRWVTCSENIEEVDKGYVAHRADDVAFACAAMQNFLPLVNEVQSLACRAAGYQSSNETLRAEIERLKEFEWKYNDLCK
jgi:hypothetical protein